MSILNSNLHELLFVTIHPFSCQNHIQYSIVYMLYHWLTHMNLIVIAYEKIVVRYAHTYIRIHTNTNKNKKESTNNTKRPLEKEKGILKKKKKGKGRWGGGDGGDGNTTGGFE